MREVVTNFLNFARPTQLTLSPVDLRRRRRSAPPRICARDARALKGDITLAGEFATVEGDDVLLRQAFSNLLRNAIEACAAAGVAASREHRLRDQSRGGREHGVDLRQRSRIPPRTNASACSIRSSRPSRRAPVSGSRSFRRSSSRTTGVCLQGTGRIVAAAW